MFTRRFSPRFALSLFCVALISTACNPAQLLSGLTGSGGAADQANSQNTTSHDGEFVVYVNPADPMLVSARTADGGSIECFGEKSTDGTPTALARVRYQTATQIGTDHATWLDFDDDGSIAAITTTEGASIEFNWTGGASAVLTAISAGGEVQVETTVDTSTAKAPPRVRRPTETVGVPARDGRRLHVRAMDPSEAASQRWTARGAKRSASAAATGTSQVFVYVTRCGSAVDGVLTSVTLDNPYSELPNTYTAFPTGAPGEYVATLPTEPVSRAGDRAKEICESLESVLSTGCTAAKLAAGQETYVCASLAAAIDAALLGPTGEGVSILAACEAGFAALRAYCETLGADGGEGTPSIASKFICGNIKSVVDRAVQNSSGTLSLQAWASGKGLTPAHSDAQNVSPTGPFPSLAIAFPDAGPIVHPITLSPADPSAGQDYVASVRVECLETGSLVTLSVAGSDDYADSTSAGASGDTTLQLVVPGAEAGVADLISIQVNGVTRLQVAVVF